MYFEFYLIFVIGFHDITHVMRERGFEAFADPFSFGVDDHFFENVYWWCGWHFAPKLILKVLETLSIHICSRLDYFEGFI